MPRTATSRQATNRIRNGRTLWSPLNAAPLAVNHTVAFDGYVFQAFAVDQRTLGVVSVKERVVEILTA